MCWLAALLAVIESGVDEVSSEKLIKHMMMNPIALRLDEASLLLEDQNMPEIVAVLQIAAREIERGEQLKREAMRILDELGKKAIRVREGGGPENVAMSLAVTFIKMQEEINRLDALINNAHTKDFLEAVRLEAAHQREKWGVEHDAGKTDEDWYWLLGYLGGKALHAAKLYEPDAMNIDANPPKPFITKQLHHIITTAAACLNWHAQRMGVNPDMRPGIEPPTGEQA